MKIFLTAFILLNSYSILNAQQKVDLILFNARIYTIDPSFTICEAVAISNGRIKATGSTKNILSKYSANNQLDLKGKFIYPGFIDAHAHFYRYGLDLQTADLRGAKSWNDILEKLKSFSKTNRDGWLIGRGWDQNLWERKEFPTREKLDQLFPDRPVVLSRIDDHAVIANKKALDIAELHPGMKLHGGQIETKNGELTGILIDNATDLVYNKIPEPTKNQSANALIKAQENCFAVGLTTVDDCGLDYKEALLIDSLQKAGVLKMRLYVMLSDNKHNYDLLFRNGKIKTDFLNVRSFKVYADGALGSRGACLLSPYLDKPGWSGFLLSERQHFDSVARIIYEHGFQMCTHAIGDSGNRTILQIYSKYLKGKNDKRWRIEHAQVVNENDFSFFGNYNIVPSVQPTHATSDMRWAGNRLGSKRMKGAYAYKRLLKENNWIPLGTDFPVEDISPLKTFFAAVIRKDYSGYPANGFQMENSLSRSEAIRGMTIWAAKANFEENEKGSIENGKFADLVILDKDLMASNENELKYIRVFMTIVNGKIVYHQNALK
ncbi:MAG TPA: amidohydrolase [Flavisolibacter sp.]|nr:amidohydrolase [Flavisolibacter sp.]